MKLNRLGLSAMILTVGGCAMPGKLFGPSDQPAPPIVRGEPEKPAAQITADQTNKPDEDALAAIEAFLERTQQYARPTDTLNPSRSADSPMKLAPSVDSTSSTRERDAAAPQPEAVANAAVALDKASQPVLSHKPPQVLSISATPASESMIAHAVAAKTEVAAPVANTPSIEAHSDALAAAWTRVLDDLESKSRDPGNANASLAYQFGRLAYGQEPSPIAELHTSEGFTPSVAALLSVAARIRDLFQTPGDSAEPVLEAVDDLRETFQAQTDPSVTTMALCRKVVAFGVYDELGEADLVAGQPIQTIVYSEIASFQSLPRDDQSFETRLATRLELLTADGRSILARDEPEVVDRCRRRRRDFFIAQKMTLPAALPPGAYVIKFSVADSISGRTSEARHPFVLGSPESVAKRD